MENPSYPKNIPAQTKNNQTPTQQKEDGAKAQITLKNLPEKNINCLSKIPEVTEEYDLQGRTMRCQKKIKINKDQCSRNGSIGDQNKNNSNMLTNILSNIFRRSMNCIAFTYQKIYSQINSQEINVAQSQITEMLSKLRKKKQRKICLLPDLLFEDKKTLVLDLDQTLVNIGFKKPPFSDFEIQLQRKGAKVTMYIIKRFGLQSFLYQMSQRYEIVVFSSLKSDLVQKILSLIDPKKHISHFLSREHCIVINQCYFIKPVRDLGRNPKKVIVVDGHSIAGSLNPQNLYKIDRFKGSAKDRKLIKLGYFLKHIAQLPQIVPVDMYRKQFESKQILIYEKQNGDKSLRKKKTQQPQNLLPNSGQRSVETFVK